MIETHGLDALIEEFDRLDGPMHFEAVAALNSFFLAKAAEVEAQVHRHTGRLAASAEVETGFDGRTWWGELKFTAPEGIFELGRGGSHYFFEPMESPEAEAEFLRLAREVIE